MKLEYPLRIYVDDEYRLRFFNRRLTMVFKPKIKEKIINAQEVINQI